MRTFTIRSLACKVNSSGSFFCTVFLVLLPVAAGEAPPRDSPKPLSGSAVAPERPLRSDWPQEVEEFLGSLEQASGNLPEFSFRIRWQLLEAQGRDWSRDSLGPDSFKSGLNWVNAPRDESTPIEGEAVLAGKGGDFRLLGLNASGEVSQWWHKQGEYLYSSRMQELLPFVTRYPCQQALESGMIAWGEGLCLLALSLKPGEYLRRAENLQLGELVRVNGDVYQTLVATPSWIKEPPTLPTRHYFPYNESKLLSWASLTPVVTYFVVPDTFRIEGAVCTYYTFDRSHRGRWTAVPKPSGRRFEAWVTEWLQSAGAFIPKTIEGMYFSEGKRKRHLFMTVSPESAIGFEPLSLPKGRRQYEPWPPFASEVYRKRLAGGGNDYANRVGLIDALGFEGKFQEVIAELKALLRDMREDRDLEPASTGGIDWHLGFALYEILQNPEAPENEALWSEFGPTEPYRSILGRALDFFARWHRAEYAPLVEQYFALYRERFGLKARVMYATERRLLPFVETETDRGLELQALVREATEDDLRLQALIGSVEAFLRDENYQAALHTIELAANLFTDPRSTETFASLSEAWQARISAALQQIVEGERLCRIACLKDRIVELRSRIRRTEPYAPSVEIARLKATIARAEVELAELQK